MMGLHEKQNRSGPQIVEFQIVIDDFFTDWIDLGGHDGITNYFHMLGASHFRFYLQKWENLYHYQNQG